MRYKEDVSRLKRDDTEAPSLGPTSGEQGAITETNGGVCVRWVVGQNPSGQNPSINRTKSQGTKSRRTKSQYK